MALQRIPCICYLIQFQEDQAEVKTFINSGTKVNTMTPSFTAKQGLKPMSINVSVPKIDGSLLETYGMTLVVFSVRKSLRKVWFFEKTFLLVNTSMKMVLRMLFLFFSNANIKFTELGKLVQRSYNIVEALPTTSRVKLINKQELAKVALDENSKTSMVYAAASKILIAMLTSFSRTSQV